MSFAPGGLAAFEILIVDDHAQMRALLLRVLQAAGARAPRIAVNGRDALAQLRVRGADLVLLDHNMPGMTGLELTARLRADPTLRARIILLSGAEGAAHEAAAHAAGVDAVLVKPVRARALLDAIARVMAAPFRTPRTGPASAKL